MGDERYYRDAPRFPRRDPLTTWSIIFLVLGAGAVAWMLLIFFLTAGGFVEGAPDAAFGLERTAWVVITALLVSASIIGLLFTVLARLGTTEGGSYLSTMGDSEVIDQPPVQEGEEGKRHSTKIQPGRHTMPPSPPEAAGEEEPTSKNPQRAQLVSRSAARVESTSGPDGRMLLSYTVPADQPRGLYGDTYIPVDTDAVLNIKTLLAKTPNA